MAVVTAGLYKVILEQGYLGVEVRNTFFYLHSIGSDDLQAECAEAFEDDILPDLIAVQNTSLFYNNIRVQNVTGILADANRDPVATAGIDVGAAAPSFLAFSIRLNRETKETRNGHKRFCGLVEENISSQFLEAGYVTQLGNVATVLVADISIVGAVFTPVIARQDAITPTNWVVNNITSGTVSGFVTSQVSRKAGRGI